MKKYKCVWLLIMFAMASMLMNSFASAEIHHYGIDDGFKYTSHVKSHVYITGYVGKKKNVTIPTKVDGLKVKCMEGFGSIEKLHIPKGIEVRYLTRARKLKKITIDRGHKEYSVENNILFNKRKTKLIRSLRKNTNPIIPKSVKQFAGASFSYTDISSFVMPPQTVKLADAMFEGCKRLKSITLNDNLKSVPAMVFSGCIKLKKIEIPNSVKSIQVGAFRRCKSLKELTIPDSVVEIGDFTFKGCSKLKRVNLGNKLKKLNGQFMFKGCRQLKELTVPKSVKLIDNLALSNNSLKRVYIYNKKCKITFKKIIYWDEVKQPAIHKGVTIYGYKGSTAEEYAKKNGNKFVSMD